MRQGEKEENERLTEMKKPTMVDCRCFIQKHEQGFVSSLVCSFFWSALVAEFLLVTSIHEVKTFSVD